jgi:glyoxylase-like metal-dependent hydrolase (beta-lactamase superfamily II)
MKQQSWARRQFIVKAGVAVAAMQTFNNLDPCCAMAADADTAHDELFELKPVADGVYAAIAAARYKVNCNAAVILTNDGVVVVDSHSKPSASFALYRQIQAVTRQPIRRIINTHFHWDHWQGNQTYAQRYPDLEIIASQRTLENLTRPDAGHGGIPYVNKQLEAVPKEIEQLREELSRATDPARRAKLESNLKQAQDYLAEIRQFKPALPTRTVADRLTLTDGGRIIDLMVLGRAHTDGDLFIYLPQDKVVATGDALIDWMPFINDGYPLEWIETLNRLEGFDFDRIIPGHGDVAPRAQLAFFRGYLADMIDAVKQAAADGASLAEMQRALPDRLAPRYEQAMSKYPLGQYRERVGLNIEMVYRKVVAAR